MKKGLSVGQTLLPLLLKLPPPIQIPYPKCGFIKCSNEATQFFSFTKIDNTRHKDLLICNPCTRFIPLKELKANPPVEFP